MRGIPAAALGVLLLAGCGGGGREEFVREAEANCKQRQTEVVRGAEEGSGEPGDYLRFFDREHEAQRQLEPPEELAADWTRYLELMQESVRHERAVFDASDYNEESVATANARRAGVQARRLADDMGLPTCADALY